MTVEETFGKLKRRLAIKIRIAQREAAKELALLIKELVIVRTQGEGKGTNGTLDSLSESYIDTRERNRKRLSSKTSPSKSNLTATGQMLNALQATSTANKATVSVKKTKRRAELTGGKSGLTNDEVRKYVEDNGREFLKLSPEEKDQLIKVATDIVKEHLRDLS